MKLVKELSSFSKGQTINSNVLEGSVNTNRVRS